MYFKFDVSNVLYLRLRRTLATLRMHLFKGNAQTATTQADDKQNIHKNIFLNILCISNYVIVLSFDSLVSHALEGCKL